MKKVIGYGALLLVVILGSCMEEISTEFERVYYHPGYSIPIGRVTYSINDVMPEDSLDAIDSATAVYNELIYYQFTPYKVPSENFEELFVVPADLSELSRKSDQVSPLMFRCNITNSIPVELGLQVYLMEGEAPLEAVIDEGRLIVEAPEQRASPYIHQQDIFIDEATMANMLQTTHLGILLSFDTQSILNDTVQLFHTDSIHIQMGLRATLNVPL